MSFFVKDPHIVGMKPEVDMDAEIAEVNDDLKEEGHCQLPSDYAAFLHEDNGILSASFTLFGTQPQRLAQDGMEDNILDATYKAEEADIVGDDEVVLGRTSGGMLVIYSDTTKHYHVTEEATGEAIYDYMTLKAFIADWSDQCPLPDGPIAP